MDNILFILIDFVGSFYAVILPLLVVIALALLYIPSMMQHGAKARNVGEAIYCYIMQTTGILLMTVGGLPTLYSVLTGRGFSAFAYIGLLAIFAIGGAVFLWHDYQTEQIDQASKAVPASIYFFTFKILGHLITIFSGLSIVLTLVLGSSAESEWWMIPTLMFFYGLLLAWCTSSDTKVQTGMFQSIPMITAAQRVPLVPAFSKAAAPTKVAKKKPSKGKKAPKKTGKRGKKK